MSFPLPQLWGDGHLPKRGFIPFASFEIYLPPSLAASPHARYQPRVVRSPAARAPGVRRAVRATRHTRAHGSLPYGQPPAPGGLRIRAYGSPLRGLPPAACSARPTPTSGLLEALSGARVRHVSRPASGSHPTRVRPVCYVIPLVRARTVYRPARAAKVGITVANDDAALHPSCSIRNATGFPTLPYPRSPRANCCVRWQDSCGIVGR